MYYSDLAYSCPVSFPSDSHDFRIICSVCNFWFARNTRGITSTFMYCWYFMELPQHNHTIQLCILTGYFFKDQQALLSCMTARYFCIIFIIPTEFSILKSMLYTKLFCSSGVTLSSIILYAQTCLAESRWLFTWPSCYYWVLIQVSHLHQAGKSVVFCLVLAQGRLPGNKAVDAAAKAAALYRPIVSD